MNLIPENLLKKIESIKNKKLINLFHEAPNRANHFFIESDLLSVDYSKNYINSDILNSLILLAEEKGLKKSIHALFSGEPVNSTENRPALHMALREPNPPKMEVRKTLEKMEHFYYKILNRHWLGYSEKPIKNIVNIGIGGSDLGPRMVTHALSPYHNKLISVYFVSNVDGTDLSSVLEKLNPEETLFILASKTFTTIETLTNAKTALKWLSAPEDKIYRHFIAVTACPKKAIAFGINENHIFEFWDWVGGRFSLWSAIGLPIMLATSPEIFKKLLLGAHQMDLHFQNEPFEKNIPVILALISILYTQSFNAQTQAIIPYDEHLKLLPSYLQQLIMESNGQSVNKKGEKLTYPSSAVIWGDVGTNGQHAFHQLLHQGTLFIPIDFIIALKNHHPFEEHHDLLFLNCLAQSQALMEGKSEEKVRLELSHLSKDEINKLAPHKFIEGNKPSTIILMEQLNPETLGALIAVYEHRVFVESVILNINPFAQYGVELGKELANKLSPFLKGAEFPSDLDASTKNLLQKYIDSKKK